MKPQRGQSRWGGVALLAGLLGSAACGQPFSAAAGAGGGGSGGAGHGGAAASGTGGVAASSGSGVAKCPAASCSAGEYCESASSTCQMCAELGRFQFGAPVATGVTVPATGSSALYPRPDRDTGQLFFVQQDTTIAHQDQIAVAASMPGEAAWTQGTLLQQLVGVYQDSGPLYISAPSVLTGLVANSVAMSTAPVLLFDSNRTTGKRQVFAAVLGAATPPAVVTLPGGAVRASRIAISLAATPPRFWWISDATTGIERLVTGTATDNTPGDVPVLLDSDCPTTLADAPWVTPGGERLLFASVHTSAPPACTPDPTITHLYQVVLSPDGTAPTKASPVFPGDTTLDTDPALTTDMCALLFARFDDQGNGQIYQAPRN